MHPGADTRAAHIHFGGWNGDLQPNGLHRQGPGCSYQAIGMLCSTLLSTTVFNCVQFCICVNVQLCLIFVLRGNESRQEYGAWVHPL